MGAVAVLVGLLFVIVHFARRGRGAHVASVPASEPGETWALNVRDMRADRTVTSTSRVLESFELRRTPSGEWEMASMRDAERWTRCDEALARVLEAKYRAYND